MKRFIIPIFLNQQGCKYKCIFCNQFKITGSSIKPTQYIDEVKNYIDTQIKKFGQINPKYKISQISFYGGSFTCLPIKIMDKYINIVKPFLKNSIEETEQKYKVIDSLRLSTRPDCINEDILKFLKGNHVETIEIGAQCLDNKLLKILNRGHTVEDVYNAFNLLKKFNFETGLQLMVGVPCETTKTIENSIKIIINKIKPNFIRIYPLIVLKNTQLEKMYHNNEYISLTINEAVERASLIAQECLKNGINVIRIGLQYNETLKESYVAGPLIPNFGDLVKNKIQI
jgi:histone acetyltransferase (RNA polymerase elongator complex component)